MAELAQTVRAEKGCIAYDLNYDTENELVLFLYEKWETKEDTLASINRTYANAFIRSTALV